MGASADETAPLAAMDTLPPEMLCEVAAWVPERARFPFFSVCLLRLGTRVPWRGESHVSYFVDSVAAVRWARENSCPWDSKTCGYAAEEGHLEALRWARENGCPWDHSTSYTCALAAIADHLEVVQWAHKNGSPCDEMVYKHRGEAR